MMTMRNVALFALQERDLYSGAWETVLLSHDKKSLEILADDEVEWRIVELNVIAGVWDAQRGETVESCWGENQ